MKIAIGADHAGYNLKEKVKDYCERKDYQIIDKGTDSESSVDYPDFAFAVAEAVSSNEADYGILVCYTGIGMSMAANKVPGIRAALVNAPELAEMTRRHNNANVLTLGAGYTDFEEAKEITKVFLSTEFDGTKPGQERHQRRVNKINNY